MNHRLHGTPPFKVVLLHGGPGAVGSMAPVAEVLSAHVGVLELLQTKATLDGQIDEAVATIKEKARTPVTLIGHSYGAHLALLIAAQFPSLVKRLILVGSSPFESAYAKDISPIRHARLSPSQQRLYSKLQTDPLNHLEEIGKMLEVTDSFDPLPNKFEMRVAPEIYVGVTPQIRQLRDSGELLTLAGQVKCPVVAIHGAYDPHPAAGVREPLASRIHHFEFFLLERCGHTPWIEKEAIDSFYHILDQFLP